MLHPGVAITPIYAKIVFALFVNLSMRSNRPGYKPRFFLPIRLIVRKKSSKFGQKNNPLFFQQEPAPLLSSFLPD
jgi:hypothetical protein